MASASDLLLETNDNGTTAAVTVHGSLESATADELRRLIGPSLFDSQFENPLTGRTDNLMEGLYLRTEAEGRVAGRAKFVRAEFVEKVKRSEHWQNQAVVPNLLAPGAEIWS